MYPLLETIKLKDGIFHNIGYHSKRMINSIKELYGREPKYSLNEMIRVSNYPINGFIKCRILYNAYSYEITFHPYKIKLIKSLKLIIADQLDYHLKYSNRKTIEGLRKKLDGNQDILIVQNGLITDSSFANVICKKNGQWYTPKSPLLKGTQRQYLLDTNQIQRLDINMNMLKEFDEIALINAMIDLNDRIPVIIQ